IAVERLRRSGHVANVARSGPKGRSPPPGRCRDRDISQLSRKFVESGDAPDRTDAKELAPELVVGKLRKKKGVGADGRTEPRANVSVLARVADLPENPSIEQQLHDPLGRERSSSGSTAVTSQSGSSATSSASQRSSMARRRCARSTCGSTRARRASSGIGSG